MTPTTLAAKDVRSMGSFTQYRKVALTSISDFIVPPGTTYETPEGLRAEDEDTRVAFDVQGGIYPIRESVFRASYEGPPFDDARLQLSMCGPADEESDAEIHRLLAELDAARAENARLRAALETCIAALDSLAEHSERGEVAVPLSARHLADVARAALERSP